MIFHKSRDYYRTKASIDKAVNQKTAYKVQVYNNAKIDELVTKYNSGETVNLQPPVSMLQAELSILNKPEVFKNYQRIINSKYTSNDNLFKMLTKDKASNELSRVVEAEVERIAKNVQYAEQVLKNYDIPLKMYNDFKAQQQNKSLANRQEILKQVAIKNNELLVSEGLNIPSSYSYRNLESTAENLLRQSQMLSKHEEINSINQNYIDEGKEPIYNQKEWIWTGEGVTTRHASNDHQKRQVNEPFIIVNDETLDIDELMYPSDPAGSPSNTYICYCEVEYLTENGGATPVDLAEPVVPEQNILSSPVTPLGALSVLKPPKEFINTADLKYEYMKDYNEYWIGETEGAFINENGKWEYKGLEAYTDGGHNDFGKFKAEQIEAHNYEVTGKQPNESNIKVKFDNTVKSIETKANELSDEVKVEVEQKPITYDDLKSKYYSSADEEYTFTKSELTFENGKQYFNGLDVTEYYNKDYQWADVPKSVIEEYNKNIGAEVSINEPITEAPAEPQPLNINELEKGMLGGEYKLPKEFKGDIEIVGSEVNSKGEVVSIATEEAIKKYNKQFENPSPVHEAVQDKSVKQPIDISKLKTYDDGTYKIDADIYPEQKKDIKFNEDTGKWEYKGLEIKGDYGTYDFGWLEPAEVEAHNKQLEAGTQVKQPINTLELEPFENGTYEIDLDIYPEQEKYVKYNENTGNWEYKGLKIHDYYEEAKYGYLEPADIVAHNESLGVDTVTGEAPKTSSKEPIYTSELHDFGDGHPQYDIDPDMYPELKNDIKYNEDTGKWEYKGLEIKGNYEEDGFGYLEHADIEAHNQSLGAGQSTGEATDYVLNNKYINSADSIKTIKHNDEIYIEDKKTGKRYVYDEKAKYERKQDQAQFQVDYNNNEINSTEHWGQHGHQIINGLLYRVKRVDEVTGRIKQDYSFYDAEMTKLTPLYDKYQELAIAEQEGKITHEEFSAERDKIFGKAEKIINGAEDNYRATRLDIDDVRDAMWEVFDMDRAVEKAPELMQDTFFVRFGHFNEEWKEVGKKVKFDGYTSTTYESNSASHFEDKMADNPNRWAILIMADEGSNGVRLNRQFNALTSEREWMLARNQEFEVVEFNEATRTAVIKLI